MHLLQRKMMNMTSVAFLLLHLRWNGVVIVSDEVGRTHIYFIVSLLWEKGFYCDLQ